MDAIKLLGDLLGNQHVPSRSGRRVLANNHPAYQHHHQGTQRPRQAGGLGGMLAGAAKLYAARKAAEAQQRAAQQRAAGQVGVHGYPDPGYCPDDFGGHARQDATIRALILIRAMIYAARSDGRVDYREENAISQQFGTTLSHDERTFIHNEFNRRIDTCTFAREVPPDLRDDVYAASLVAIDVDTNQEARYLHDLAHELGLTHQHCNALHRRYGEPPLFR